jgi:hypothetical protein
LKEGVRYAGCWEALDFRDGLLLAAGCGSGSGGMAFGPTGDGPPNDSQQQSTPADAASLCQPFCQGDVACGDTDFSDVGDCVSECQLALGQATCRNETVALLSCVSRYLGNCDLDVIAAACSAQIAASDQCDANATSECTNGACGACSDPCEQCNCQHPNNPTPCDNVCGTNI